MRSDTQSGWQIDASEYVIDTKYLRLRRDSITLPDGTEISDYYVRESLGYCVIFAMTSDERVVLVRQYKHGVGRPVLELPAGAIDAGETPAACARRELEEETGYVGSPAELEAVATFVTEPTNSNGRFFLFLARNAAPTGVANPEPTESIEVELATLPELLAYVRNGTIEVSPHVTSIYWMLDRLSRLSALSR